MPVTRFGVSLEEKLLRALDDYAKENQFANRSQSIRQLVEKNVVEKKWRSNEIVAGALVLLYNHHKRDLVNKSNSIQHDYHDLILSVQHYHLNHETCFEILALKGSAKKLTQLSDKLIGIKGIQHGQLVMSKAD